MMRAAGGDYKGWNRGGVAQGSGLGSGLLRGRLENMVPMRLRVERGREEGVEVGKREFSSGNGVVSGLDGDK